MCIRAHAPQVYNTPQSHVTRDWQEETGRLGDLVFRVMDTSGMEPGLQRDGIQARARAKWGAGWGAKWGPSGRPSGGYVEAKWRLQQHLGRLQGRARQHSCPALRMAPASRDAPLHARVAPQARAASLTARALSRAHVAVMVVNAQ